MFKKKILVGHSEDAILAIIEQLEKSNIPFEIGIKDILKRSSEEYEGFYKIKVQKKCAKQVESIVAQYVSQEDLKHWYKVAKKKSRKLERKEKALYLLVAFIYFIAVAAIEMGKSLGLEIVPSIGCAVLLMGGMFMTIKFYKEMKKESGDLRETYKGSMIVGIALIFYAVTSFISVFRLFSWHSLIYLLLLSHISTF
ncbi:hypothetical protein ABE61_15305 [Lysinibacillus sphaericus]|uniref:hypothetical protein n=1 Tax=Lysinibacillus sphaericus TaxID=1421 RepID=UPI0018CEDDE2|nr:hypothetical protein [Lysinibacillus sphaericus]MBG9455400.1 hypothetical protein [Lysinibacillus sphaericus]MBG9476376.1 hypothetical protein [Lysinibacillus sphaericus]MBG9592681.1 hypothetical protein [Lysinibacillus sphaericus]